MENGKLPHHADHTGPTRSFNSLMAYHLIGFGGQGKAIAPSLLEAGFKAIVYLQAGSPSFEKCKAANIPAQELSALAAQINENDSVILSCPDRVIGEVYERYLAAIPKKINLVFLHGFAVWSKSIEKNSEGTAARNPLHTLNLLAPKAIGPELREAIVHARASQPNSRSPSHTLKAALFTANPEARAQILSLATEGLGFKAEHLIPATFEQETVGDLISEQLLLCGGLFSLLEWTIQEMQAAGVPEALIQEECITELGLIVNVLRKRGLAATIEAISDSAKAGAVMMRERFLAHGLPSVLHTQAQEVLNGTFLKNLQNDSQWKSNLKEAFHEHSR